MKALLALWQAPQILLGLLVALVLRATRVERGVYSCRARIGVSFGPVVILHEGPLGINPTSLAHERGHSKQSLILGPLYLIVVGIPSLTMNLMSTWSMYRHIAGHGNGRFALEYYRRWPENWADKLGGVQR